MAAWAEYEKKQNIPLMVAFLLALATLLLYVLSWMAKVGLVRHDGRRAVAEAMGSRRSSSTSTGFPWRPRPCRC